MSSILLHNDLIKRLFTRLPTEILPEILSNETLMKHNVFFLYH